MVPPSFAKTTLGPASGGHGQSTESRARLAEGQRKPYRHTCAKCGARRVDKQIGLEDTIEEWAQTLVEVFRLVRQVLSDDGTLWLNIGFSYDGRGNLIDQPGILKDALVSDGWYCKAHIVWSKSNPMPSSQEKRPTLSHEMVWLLAKHKGTGYFYDADAVREPQTEPGRINSNPGTQRDVGGIGLGGVIGGRESGYNPAGRNRRTVWEIATEPFPEAHFATFPKALVTPCILAGTSQYGHCPECGARWVRVVEREFVPQPDVSAERNAYRGKPLYAETVGSTYRVGMDRGSTQSTTTGWRPTCDHNLDPAPDIVLDPFAGSGTVGQVAEQLGRRYIMIDLNGDYEKMQKRRTAQTGMAL